MKNKTMYATIDSLDIDELIAMKKNQKYLDMHPYAVWQSKDGKWWHTTLPDATKDRGVRQIKRKTRAELNDAIAEYWESESTKRTVEDVFHEWNDNRLELQKVVEATYISANYIFKRHFGNIAAKPIDEIKPIEWSDFLEREVVRGHLTKDLFSNLKGVVSGMLRWAYRHDYIDYSISAVNDLLDISSKSFQNNRKDDADEVFSEEETPRIIEYLINHPILINLGLLLMFVTGIRIGELISLKHGDFVGNTIKIRRTGTKILSDGKIGRGIKDSPKSQCGIRDIIVSSNYQWLLDYFAQGNKDDYIFVTRFGNIYRYDCICRYLRIACENLGIPYRSPHKIRKTYTSILLDNNVDTRFVIEQVGHSTITCTENYYHKDRKNLQKKAEIINGIKEFGNMPNPENNMPSGKNGV